MSDAPKQNKSDIKIEGIDESYIDLNLDQSHKVYAEKVYIYNTSPQTEKYELTEKQNVNNKKVSTPSSFNTFQNTRYGMLLFFIVSTFLLLMFIGTLLTTKQLNFVGNSNPNNVIFEGNSETTIQDSIVNSANNSQATVNVTTTNKTVNDLNSNQQDINNNVDNSKKKNVKPNVNMLEPTPTNNQILEKESQAFEALIKKDYKLSKKLFSEAYKIYPTWRNIDEINKILASYEEKFTKIEDKQIIWKEIYCEIAKKQKTYGMSKKVLKKFNVEVNKLQCSVK